ncbi:SDR family NAD(P)-dependent oxidoreductase [Hydrogenophaga palleronii]|uniref:SDR family NAD(P)-dependent oxidoreductase n=1 Tax=Hydrogenophaga palleronii TaxID=65655 RepID=UPI000825B768|nr:glucose 1-dehydrogenase [Hydrogenophaga palleronii]
MNRVENKVAVISGGASGLGKAAARLLAAQGAAVVIADLNEAAGHDVVAEIAGQGGRAEFIRLDVTQEQDWVQAYEGVLARHQHVDVAVHAAGIFIAQSFPSETDYELWRKVMSVNVDGVFLGTKHAVAAMQRCATPAGSIINLASIMGLVAMPGRAAYAASKGAVRLYTKSVALSCAERQLPIRANAICPGFIHTEMLDSAARTLFDSYEEGVAHYSNLQPVGRLGTPEDIARAILYLASDESGFMTGSDLVIDGGYTAR